MFDQCLIEFIAEAREVVSNERFESPDEEENKWKMPAKIIFVENTQTEINLFSDSLIANLSI